MSSYFKFISYRPVMTFSLPTGSVLSRQIHSDPSRSAVRSRKSPLKRAACEFRERGRAALSSFLLSTGAFMSRQRKAACVGTLFGFKCVVCCGEFLMPRFELPQQRRYCGGSENRCGRGIMLSMGFFCVVCRQLARHLRLKCNTLNAADEPHLSIILESTPQLVFPLEVAPR